jgi:signal transduction histidine kinase
MYNDIAFGIVIGILFVSVLVLFCVLLVKLYINKIKNYTKIIYQKDIDFQKALNQTIVETQEQVLNNISEDLHDDAGQQLTLINFEIEQLKLEKPELVNELEGLSNLVANLSLSIRSISHSLNNQLVLKQDVIKAIAIEVQRIKKNAKLTLQLIISDKSNRTFSSNEQIIIYRIFQENINNIIKHSKAKQVEVVIENRPLFCMTIKDDGIGFDTKNAEKGRHLGLITMKKRASIINFEIIIESKPNKGTTFILKELLKK